MAEDESKPEVANEDEEKSGSGPLMGVLAFFKRRSGAIQLAMMIVVLAVSVILGALLRNRRPPFTSRQVQLCVRQAKL